MKSRTGNHPIAKPLHTHDKGEQIKTDTHRPFEWDSEPTIPVFELSKTIYFLDRVGMGWVCRNELVNSDSFSRNAPVGVNAIRCSGNTIQGSPKSRMIFLKINLQRLPCSMNPGCNSSMEPAQCLEIICAGAIISVVYFK